ncbi:MAG: polysulfide reductase [Planctomycetes bacterium]|nr:polysulfide reductase [Planctomycetota bacterium]
MSECTSRVELADPREPGWPEVSVGWWRNLLWVLWAAFAAAGVVGVAQRFLYGHLPAGYGSYVPWGLWVGLYFHGVGIAGGAFVLAGLGHVFDVPGFRHPAVLRVAIVLALAAILPAFLGIWLDLGRMERAANIFLSPSFTSMMAFNAWLYNAFILVSALCWLLSYRPGSTWLKPFLCLGAFLSAFIPSQSGSFFGVVDAKPYWHSALLPVLFVTSALTAGAAMLLVVRMMLGPGPLSAEEHATAIRRLRMVTLGALVVYFFLEFAEFSIALWNPHGHDRAFDLVLFGPNWWMFWIVHVLLGGLVPLVLFLQRGWRRWMVGSLLVAVTFVSVRLNVLIPGQAVGEIRGLQEAYQHPRLTYVYHATLMEYLVGFLMLAAGMTVFYLGCRISERLAARFQQAS